MMNKKVLLLSLTIVSFLQLGQFAQFAMAAERIHTCVGKTDLVSEGQIRVNIIRSGGVLKATLFEGSSLNSWNTYLVTENGGTYQGSDRSGREFEADIDGQVGHLVKAVAPDVNSSSGMIELKGIRLKCSE
jgi:hypothetical protein